jgi:hypothetical protein
MAAAAKAHRSAAVNPSLKFFCEIVRRGTKPGKYFFSSSPQVFGLLKIFFWIFVQPLLIKTADSVQMIVISSPMSYDVFFLSLVPGFFCTFLSDCAS